MGIAKIIERTPSFKLEGQRFDSLKSVVFAVGRERAECAITIKQIDLCSFTLVAAV